MRMLRRRLVLTPMLIAMVLLALGLPAYDACRPVGEPAADQTECCAISEDCCAQDQYGVQCGARGMKLKCIPSHDCCSGGRSELAGYL